MPTKEEVNNFSLIHYCNASNMESEVAASLLTKAVLADLTVELQDLNMLRKRGKKAGRLPI